MFRIGLENANAAFESTNAESPGIVHPWAFGRVLTLPPRRRALVANLSNDRIQTALDLLQPSHHVRHSATVSILRRCTVKPVAARRPHASISHRRAAPWSASAESSAVTKSSAIAGALRSTGEAIWPAPKIRLWPAAGRGPRSANAGARGRSGRRSSPIRRPSSPQASRFPRSRGPGPSAARGPGCRSAPPRGDSFTRRANSRI